MRKALEKLDAVATAKRAEEPQEAEPPAASSPAKVVPAGTGKVSRFGVGKREEKRVAQDVDKRPSFAVRKQYLMKGTPQGRKALLEGG